MASLIYNISMIITNFDRWNGYQFGNKLLGVNNLLQISHFYKQDYYFNYFNGLELFDINTETKKYNAEPYEILNLTDLFNKKNEDLVLNNNIIYYLEPCLFEFFHKYDSISTFDIFKLKETIFSDKKSIGVHFRGTDFNLWDQKSILPFDYYKNSIDFIINDIDGDFEFILFSDDYSLDSYIKTVNYLTELNISYKLGTIGNFKEDFILMSSCDYIVSTPSTFCIVASICGKKNKKIIQNKDWVIEYKGESDYFRDIFWKNVGRDDNNNYKIYKLL